MRLTTALLGTALLLGSMPARADLLVTAEEAARIDTDSVRLTYLKSPEIDLTGRIRPFLTPEGIDMKQADLPPGEHALRLELRDSEGRIATTTFVVSIRR